MVFHTSASHPFPAVKVLMNGTKEGETGFGRGLSHTSVVLLPSTDTRDRTESTGVVGKHSVHLASAKGVLGAGEGRGGGQRWQKEQYAVTFNR